MINIKSCKILVKKVDSYEICGRPVNKIVEANSCRVDLSAHLVHSPGWVPWSKAGSKEGIDSKGRRKTPDTTDAPDGVKHLHIDRGKENRLEVCVFT